MDKKTEKFLKTDGLGAVSTGLWVIGSTMLALMLWNEPISLGTLAKHPEIGVVLLLAFILTIFWVEFRLLYKEEEEDDRVAPVLFLNKSIMQIFPSLRDTPFVDKGFLCRHGMHSLSLLGDEIDQIQACKKCGVVYKVHVYRGLLNEYPSSTLVGYVDPKEIP